MAEIDQKALAPTQKYSPRRSFILILDCFLGIVISLFYLLAAHTKNNILTISNDKFSRSSDKDDKYQLIILLFLFIISGFIEVIGIASIAFITLFKSPKIVTGNVLYMEIIGLLNLSAYDATLIIGVTIIILFTLSNFLSAYVLWRSVRFTAYQQHKISMKVIENTYISHMTSFEE